MTNGKGRVVAACAAMVLATAGPWLATARGQGVVGKAQASTGGGGQITVKGTFNPMKKPTGISVAGARAFQANVADIEISDANNANRGPAPKTDEKINILTLLTDTKLFATGAAKKDRQTQMDKLEGVANAATKDDGVNFIRIDKSKGLTAKASVAAGDGKVGNENASATAIQTVKNNSVVTTGTTVSSSVLQGTNAVSLPSVAAVAVNRDPVAVQWTSASDHTTTLDLTGSSFSASTTGLGTTALAASSFQVSYVDGATSLSVTEPSTPVLDVALGVGSDDGDSPTPFGFLLSYTGGGTISDSLGGMGMAQVDADLGGILTLMPDGSFAIVGPYSITFDVGGTSGQGVLFVDNSNFGVSAVPEPSSVVLCALGALVLACHGRLRIRAGDRT